MKKCNKCSAELTEAITLSQAGKANLIICNSCFEKDKAGLWLTYGKIVKEKETDSQIIKETLKECGHVGDACITNPPKLCGDCEKIFPNKRCSNSCDGLGELTSLKEYKAGKCKKCQGNQLTKSQEQQDETNYRYCFQDDKWLNKSEINEVNWGNQPEGNGKSYNCVYCHKDLGDQIQIFRCPKHPSEILKVWGTLDGENKEKVFYKECPQKQQPQQPQPIPNPPNQPNKGGGMSRGNITLIISAICILLAGGGFGLWWWQSKKSKDREQEEEQI